MEGIGAAPSEGILFSELLALDELEWPVVVIEIGDTAVVNLFGCPSP